MIATSANWRDVQKYYEQSYIKIQGFGDKLFHVERVRESVVTGYDEDDTMFELYLSNSAGFSMDYILPHRAVFQHGRDAYLLRRLPARQYRRGLCADNVIITNLTTGEGASLGFDVLKAYVSKPKYPTLSEAIKSEDVNSCPLTQRLSYNRASREIKVDTTKVAIFLPGKQAIKVTRPIFLKEISDYVKHNYLSFEVIV